MGIRKNKSLLDNSNHKPQRKVSPIKSSASLLLTKKASSHKVAKQRQIHWTTTTTPQKNRRFQRQVLFFVVVLLHHAEKQDVATRIHDDILNATNFSSFHNKASSGLFSTLTTVQTHSSYSWIRNATWTPPSIENVTLRTSQLLTTTGNVAKETSLAIVKNSQLVLHQVESASKALVSIPVRWSLPKTSLLPLTWSRLAWNRSKQYIVPKLLLLLPSSSQDTSYLGENALVSSPERYLRLPSSTSHSNVPFSSDKESMAAVTPTTSPKSNHLRGGIGGIGDSDSYSENDGDQRSKNNMDPTMSFPLSSPTTRASPASPQNLVSVRPLTTTVERLLHQAQEQFTKSPQEKFRMWVRRIHGATLTQQYSDSRDSGGDAY